MQCVALGLLVVDALGANAIAAEIAKFGAQLRRSTQLDWAQVAERAGNVSFKFIGGELHTSICNVWRRGRVAKTCIYRLPPNDYYSTDLYMVRAVYVIRPEFAKREKYD